MGSNLSLEESFFAYFISSKFLENNFLEGKRRTDPDLIHQIGNPTLGSLSYLNVGVQLRGGSRLKPGMVSGHGWVERDSSQVIWSSKQEVRSILIG